MDSTYKKIVKKLMIKSSQLMCFATKMTEKEARDILNQYSPKPSGKCAANHEIKEKYDLQIIVPAYNSEKYIAECMQSILEQKTQYKILVAVVNDGSVDETGTILSNYSGEHGNILIDVVTRENGGFSTARNSALTEIYGRYVMFLDSDDVLPDGTIEKMIAEADSMKLDILQGSWYIFDSEKRENHILSKTGIVKNGREVLSGYAWGKIYKNTVWENFQYPEGFWYEDTPILFMLAEMPYRCGAIRDVVYGYRHNLNGITATSVGEKKSVDSYWITEENLEEFPIFGLKYDQTAYEYVLRQSRMNWMRVSKQPWKIREAVFVLTAELIDRYFKGFHTTNGELKAMEKALRKKQLLKFAMIMHGM